MSDELKPCPFCGGTEAKLTECRAEWGVGWHVTCKHCLSVGATAYSDRVGVRAKTPEEKERQMKAYAVANWNRRTPSDRVADVGKKVDDNPPLTLEELRKMDGEPVRIIFYSKTSKYGVWNGWALVDLRFSAMEFLEHNLKFEYYGKSWLAYRRKPEEETK